MRPSENSYIVPHTRLIGGEYPYDPDPDKGLQKLRACLDAGITCFIDLTAAIDGLEPYEPALLAEAEVRGQMVRRINLPVRDCGIPTPQRAAGILDAIDAELQAGGTVYLHCWGGVGRTGTIVGCFLRERGLSADEAIATVERLFQTTSPDKRRRHPNGTFHSSEQREFVRTWSRE
jgi:hypothetical protein